MEIDRLSRALSGRYSIEREVGRGATAIIYLAHDLKHDRPVAIKVLHPELASMLGGRRFLREIQIEARLQHLNILPLHDSGNADGLLYYVTPYIEGGSLRDRLKRDRQMPFEDALRVISDIADALNYAHEQGFVHRDIKPENILLWGDHAVLGDFGIARAIDAAGGKQITESGHALGTPAYMSPEQAAGEEHLDGRSDIYSLACVGYEMLAGEPPFSSQSARALIAKHIAEPPPSLDVLRPSTPRHVPLAIKKALSKTPADRFSTASEFKNAVIAPAADPALPRTPARRLGVGLLGLALAVALSVAVAVFASRRTNSPAPASFSSSLAFTRIAVLYFDDRSAHGSLADLASGLTEDLIDRLQAVEDFHVVAARAVRPYAGQPISPDSLARLFGAGIVVYGDIDTLGDSVRAVVRLVDPATGVQVDRISVEAARGEPLALQREAAELLAHGLRAWIGKEVSLARQLDPTSSDLAWENFAHGRRLLWDARRLVAAGAFEEAEPWLERAEAAFREAAALDPDWVSPQLDLGRLFGERALLILHDPDVSLAEPTPEGAKWIRTGLAQAEGILSRRPEHPEALELRGYLRFRLALFGEREHADSLMDLAVSDLTHAVQLDDKLTGAWSTLSEIYTMQGKKTLATFAAEKALEMDVEESVSVLARLFFSSLQREAYGDARTWCEQGRKHYPESRNFLECEFTLLGWTGSTTDELTQAWGLLAHLDSIPRLDEGKPHRRFYVAAILARAGLADSARSVMARARSESPARVQEDLAPLEAYVRALLGEEEIAIDLLRTALAREGLRRSFIAQHPWYRSLRSNAEFQALVSEPRIEVP